MRLVVLVAAALLLAPAAFASEQASDAERARERGHVPRLHTTLAQSNSDAAKAIERVIQGRIRAGWTKSRSRTFSSSSTGVDPRGAAEARLQICLRGATLAGIGAAALILGVAGVGLDTRAPGPRVPGCAVVERPGADRPRARRRVDEELRPLRVIGPARFPGRVPRGLRLVHRSVRAPAGAGLPFRGFRGRGRATGEPGTTKRSSRQPSVRRRLHSAFVALGAGAGLVGNAVSLTRRGCRRWPVSWWSSSGSRFVGLLPFPERLVAAGPRRRREGARLGGAARCRLRGVRRAVLWGRARDDSGPWRGRRPPLRAGPSCCSRTRSASRLPFVLAASRSRT